MRGIFFAWMVVFSAPAFAQEPVPIPDPGTPSVALETRPAKIETADLKEFEGLSEPRKRIIRTALDILRDWPWLPYTENGAQPETGGFDCSGAAYFILKQCGLEPPRSSTAQFEWLKSNNRLHSIPPDTVVAKPTPGDLVFWAVSAATPEDPAAIRIHHVAIYLGTEKKDGRAVMINATDGRAYRGQKGNGYGVYDFELPPTDSPSQIAGYGTPPGVPE